MGGFLTDMMMKEGFVFNSSPEHILYVTAFVISTRPSVFSLRVCMYLNNHEVIREKGVKYKIQATKIH